MASSAQQEVRIDPADNVGRTLEELRAVCKDQYSEQEILDYWERTMLPAAGQARTAGAGTMTQQTSGGPVVTQLPGSRSAAGGSARTLSQSAPAENLPPVGDVSVDPFLTSDRNRDVADVRQDPFLTHGDGRTPPEVRANYDPSRSMSRRQQVAEAAAAAKKHWTESLFRLLGPGDPDRNPQARNIIIFGPWLLFLWVLCVWLVLRRYSQIATIGLTALIALGGLTSIFLWYVGRRGGPVSLVTIGLLTLVACACGTALGIYGWERFFRQYWWTQTGFQGGATTAATPAMARSDFAVINFWNEDLGVPYNDTRVDPEMAAGYKDTEYYCVAPILDPRAAQASLKRVNFWAVGVNCCQRYGHFTCDDTREWNAGTGVVMLEGGYPCPSCTTDQFRKAVVKAEAAFGLVSAEGAVFVRWVKDPASVINGLLFDALAYLMLCAFLGAAVSALIGWLMWYYGVGLRRPGDLSQLDLGASRSNVILDATSLGTSQQKLMQ